MFVVLFRVCIHTEQAKKLALSRYMSNPNITLTLTSKRVIVIYSNTFRLLIYRESAKKSGWQSNSAAFG